ncbi:MAG: hypothetical protein ACTSV7_06660 [Candidatus Baldrarchaeia archaeon]
MSNGDYSSGPSHFWPALCDESLFVEIECGEADVSLAADVLTTYNVPMTTTAQDTGGNLKNLDIKRQDALGVIKLSLMEEAGDGSSIYEPIVTEDGEVDFVKIGSSTSTLRDVYYTIQTKSYVETCAGVMITGGKPFPIRRALDWKPIWGDSLQFFNTDDMLSNCMVETIDQYATLTYNDPHFDSAFEDGIDNMYNIGLDNAWDRIMGWAYYTNLGPNADEYTTFAQQSPAEVPVRVSPLDEEEYPNVGDLERPLATSDPNQACWTSSLAVSQGVEIPIPDGMKYETVRETTVSKFMGVSEIYIVGMLLNDCYGTPKTDAQTKPNTEENTRLWIGADDTSRYIFKCIEGFHYVIKYAEFDPDPLQMENPRVVFANQARFNDNAKFGTGVEYNIKENSNLHKLVDEHSGLATILPTGGEQGVMVAEIWAVIQIDTPSFIIKDPIGRRADDIARDFECLVSPLVVTEEPEPKAFNGELIDQVEGKQDSDPTTVQDFTETDEEAALDVMQGGGTSMTFSFFNAEEIRKVSGAIFDYMNAGDGIETTYICGPTCEPKLGLQGPTVGIINSITYSYNDSGSYTISVSEGPRITGGFAEFGGGIFPKQTESKSAEATIIQDLGNHVHYKVLIDEIGVKTAFNCCASVLRVGDKVGVSIHNNAVEM